MPLQPIIYITDEEMRIKFLELAHRLGYFYERTFEFSVRNINGWTLQAKEAIRFGALRSEHRNLEKGLIMWYTDLDYKSMKKQNPYTLVNSLKHMEEYIRRIQKQSHG